MSAKNIGDLIGNTPLVRLTRLIPQESAEIYAKLESCNPGGSIKDRIAWAMIKDAEERGLLKEGGAIVEATSGNTGIGLAMIGAALGYRVILTMPEGMSLERIYILNSYGAEIVSTPAIEGMAGAIKRAEEIAQEKNAFMPLQFANKANPEIHRKTTAVEILRDMDKPIDAFVAAVGTGGTITGVGEVLKTKNQKTQVVAVEPASAAVLSGDKPGPHKIQGIGADFIPEIVNVSIIDEIIKVSDSMAFDTSKQLALTEGFFVGISSGANFYASLKIAEKLGRGKTVVTVFPDTGERYFSMAQFF